MRAIVPTAQLGNRIQTQGRIRMGVRTEKAMKSLEHWRFTSPDESAIRALATRYGGEAKPWVDAKASPSHQFQVLTDTKAVRIFLPQNSLNIWYEQWGGGGVIRRCDGELVEIAQGDDLVQVPCICDAQQAMACKVHVRLNVILPDIPFGGTWLMETKGWNAAQEMPGMADMIDQLQTFGVVEATLRLDTEERMVRGRKKRYPVPRIILKDSADALLAGTARLGAIGPGKVAEVFPALPGMDPVEAEWFEETAPLELRHPSELPDDDDTIDAEIVEPTVDQVDEPGRAVPDTTAQSPAFKRFVILCAERSTEVSRQLEAIEEDDLRHALAWWASDHRTDSSKELTVAELDRALEAITTVSQHAVVRVVQSYAGRPI